MFQMKLAALFICGWGGAWGEQVRLVIKAWLMLELL